MSDPKDSPPDAAPEPRYPPPGTKLERPEWLQPDYPPLEGETLKRAAEGQRVKYPMVVRKMRDPPLSNQVYSNLSFMFFEKPKMVDGSPVYGFVKNRGNWPTPESADGDATRIIREVDSRFRILTCITGQWVPLTNARAFVDDMRDVRMKEDEVHLQDQGVKDAAKERRKVERELRERCEEVKKGDIYDDPDHIRYYSMKRVTEFRLVEALQPAQNEVLKIQRDLLETRLALKRLECKHPTHSAGWLQCYNDERTKSGLPPYKPGEHEFDEYEAATIPKLEAALAAIEKPVPIVGDKPYSV